MGGSGAFFSVTSGACKGGVFFDIDGFGPCAAFGSQFDLLSTGSAFFVMQFEAVFIGVSYLCAEAFVFVGSGGVWGDLFGLVCVPSWILFLSGWRP